MEVLGDDADLARYATRPTGPSHKDVLDRLIVIRNDEVGRRSGMGTGAAPGVCRQPKKQPNEDRPSGPDRRASNRGALTPAAAPPSGASVSDDVKYARNSQVTAPAEAEMAPEP